MQSTSQQVLNYLFDQIQEIRGSEQVVNGEKFNSFLSSDPQRFVLLSPSELGIITLVINNCSLLKPQRLNRNTFVNFFLPSDQRFTFDQSLIMNKLLDITKNEQIDNSVRQLFDQIRPTIGNDVFERSFNADPRAVKSHYQNSQNQILPKNILGSPGGIGDTSMGRGGANRSLNRIVIGSDMRQSNIDSYTPMGQIPDYVRTQVPQFDQSRFMLTLQDKILCKVLLLHLSL